MMKGITNVSKTPQPHLLIEQTLQKHLKEKIIEKVLLKQWRL